MTGSIRLKTLVLILMLPFLFTACTKSPESNSSNDSRADSTNSQAFDTEASIDTVVTDCGVVIDDKLQNPVSLRDAEPVIISDVLSSTIVQITNISGETELVKIAGITESSIPIEKDLAKETLKALNQAFIFRASNECTVMVRGVPASVAQMHTGYGESVAELLLKKGIVAVDSTDNCGNLALLTSCYQAIKDDAPKLNGGTISNFLWKPSSERNGNLVVLLNPSNATVMVNGEILSDSGPSNGRGTTARGSRPGCAYGRATIKVFDSSGFPLVFPNGDTKLTVNGCDRLEM
ncbi:MAG: hypothetical protein D6719_09775 [Candidatus Dadabacteria bacterium]|nr:MAG: hypothetical protein D6719_09775 [Candidatus Dadabacteria bacterium]